MRRFLAPLFALALSGLTGCMSTQKATIAPGTDLSAIKTYYVVHLPKDTRQINRLICDNLSLRGCHATTGEEGAVPADVDAVVTYQDKWMWDITMYMIQLDIQIRKPVSQVALANGQVMHTSLVRRSPPEMVKEVLDQIFNKAPPATIPPTGQK